MVRLALILLTLALLPSRTEAQDVRYEEGPRRAAELLSDSEPLGFSISLAPDASEMQAFFDQGLVQCFSAWFHEAERSFQTILINDPDCPMAYWGLAQANVQWPVRAKWFARAAWLKRGLASPRERRLIDALARYYGVLGSEEPAGMVEPWNPAPGEDRRPVLLLSEQTPPQPEQVERLTEDYRAIVAKDPADLMARALLVGHLLRTYENTVVRETMETELRAIFSAAPLYPVHAYGIRHYWGIPSLDEELEQSAESVTLSAGWVPSSGLAAAAVWLNFDKNEAAIRETIRAVELINQEAGRRWVEPASIQHYAALMATLGPERAAAYAPEPIQAPDWTLDDAYGQTFSLEDYRGKPLLIVNFLGFGCVHCLEQLQALLPLAPRFEKLGVEIVAIGLQTPEELRVSMGEDPLKSGYPFPILCDPKLGQFKAYHSFDDFADTALHGTYLLDADGHVQWHDISHLPYMDIASILKRADAEAR